MNIETLLTGGGAGVAAWLLMQGINIGYRMATNSKNPSGGNSVITEHIIATSLSLKGLNKQSEKQTKIMEKQTRAINRLCRCLNADIEVEDEA